MRAQHRIVGMIVGALLIASVWLPAAVADPVPTPLPTGTPTQVESTEPAETPSDSGTAMPAETLPVEETAPPAPPSSTGVPESPAPEETTVTTPSGGDVVDPSALLVIDEPASVPSTVLDVYAAALSVARNNPNDFGYPQVVDGSVVLPGVSDIAVSLSKADRKAQAALLRQYAKSQRKANKGKPAPDYDPGDAPVIQIQVQAAPARRSAAQLDEINDAVFDLHLDPSFKSAGIVETGIDAGGRVVVIVHTLTPGLVQRIVKLYGTRDVVVQENPDMNPGLAYSRQFDTLPYNGGARIAVPPSPKGEGRGCTSGFAWQIDTVQYMLTAGHCAPDGGAVGVPQESGGKALPIGWVDTDGTMDTWDVGTGTVPLFGQSVTHGDLAMIRIMNGSVWPRIYRGDPASNQYTAVTEMWNRPSSIGDKFCTGGSQSGEICDWTVDLINTHANYTDPKTNAYDGTLRNATRGYHIGGGIVEGDSGGPVFTVRPSDGNIAAKGIVSGFEEAAIPYVTNSYVCFTDIWQAFDAFPGYLMNAAVSGAPFGNLESATGGVGSVTVSGWAVDPDQPQTPLDINVYIGGPAGTGEGHDIGLAKLGRSDLVDALANWDAGPNHGFATTVVTNLTGDQPVYVYILNAPGSKGGNSLLWSGVVTIPTASPFGSFDTVSSSWGGTITVTGWAIDADRPSTPVDINVYIGGLAGTGEGHDIGPARVIRNDVATANPYGLNAGSAHGFNTTVSTSKTGTVTVYVYALNVVGSAGSNILLGTKTVTILPGNPFGALDKAIGQAGSVLVGGWAIDGDSPETCLTINVYIGGPAGTGEGHNLGAVCNPRTDVNNVYPFTGVSNHGFTATITTSKRGSQAVYVYALNTPGTGGGNTQLGAVTVTIT